MILSEKSMLRKAMKNFSVRWLFWNKCRRRKWDILSQQHSTNCRYSIPDKPDVSLSKNTLKYGESTEMHIKNLGSSGNTDIDHQEFKMNIPARLDIEKIKMPEFDNADVSCILMGKSGGRKRRIYSRKSSCLHWIDDKNKRTDF